MSPEQRAEHLEHAMDMATANDVIAEEGESRVRLDEKQTLKDLSMSHASSIEKEKSLDLYVK